MSPKTEEAINQIALEMGRTRRVLEDIHAVLEEIQQAIEKSS